MRSIEPGISRFRVWSFGPSRNDGGERITKMPFIEPVTLRGAHARLEPLSHDQRDGLTEAVRDGELWNLWYTFVPAPEDMTKEIDRRLGLQAAGSMLPLTVFDA